MTGLQIGFGFTGVLLGAVIGVVGKGVFDHWNGRKTRLLDEKLKHAVAFLAAADRYCIKTVEHIATFTTMQSTGLSTEQRQQYQADHDSQIAEAREAKTKAQEAYNALRLLLPTVAPYASRYLHLCGFANPHPDDQRVDRERARGTVESEIQRVLST